MVSKLKYKLGDSVEYSHISLKNRICGSNLEPKTNRISVALPSPKNGIIAGHRRMPVGKVIYDFEEPAEFKQTGTVSCYLVAYNIHKKPDQVEEQFISPFTPIKNNLEIISPYENTLIKVIKTIKYKFFGYIYREELISFSEDEPDEIIDLKVCYSLDGLYLGDNKTANLLCRKLGIRQFEKTGEDHTIASIGFQPEEQKWYGWSHRAYHGFGIGSTVKPGDCAYSPYDKEDLQLELFKWYDIGVERECSPGQTCVTKLISATHNVLHKEEYIKHEDAIAGSDELVESGIEYGPEEVGIEIVSETVFSDPSRKPLSNVRFNAYPEVWGKGSWTANTLDDAKEMAIAFADDVS